MGIPSQVVFILLFILGHDSLVKTRDVGSKGDDYCYERLCTCQGQQAKCVRTSLTYIPEVSWTNITSFKFSINTLHNINVTTFANISLFRIEKLDLTFNLIETISATAFSVLRHLVYLDLSANPLITPELLSVGLAGLNDDTLRILIMTGMKFKYIPQTMFQGMKYSRVERVDLGTNHITHFDQAVFNPLTHLKEIFLYTNSLVSVKWSQSSTVTHFKFNGNQDLGSLPSFCNEKNKPFYPNLKRLMLNELSLKRLAFDTFACLPSLEVLALSSNPLIAVETNTFAFLPNINTVLLQDIQHYVHMGPHSFNNTHLQIIRINTKSKQIDRGVFDGCYGLIELDLTYNSFEYITDDLMSRWFRDLTNMVKLTMKSTKLQRFPKVIHTEMPNLEILIISENKIEFLPKGLFQNLTKLIRFDIAMNQLTSPNEDAFTEAVQHQLKDVSLAGNPLSCTCDTRWFMDWLRRETVKFRGYPHSYACNSPPEYVHRLLVDIFLSEQPCLLARTTYIIFVAASIPVILSFIVVSILYRWRWHIRYIIFLLKHQGHHRRPTANHFRFDAYVIYSPEDTNWLVRHMIPILEKQRGMSLCIHERDFDVGGVVVDNIVENVEDSRRILLVLTKNSLQSDWCQFEISFAHKRSLHANPGSICIILIEEIDSQFITNSIRVLLEHHGYITWPDNQDEIESRQLFWDRVAGHIIGERNAC